MLSSSSKIDSISYTPLIIIGAARSGTRLVRDSIALHPAIDCVPYDINYIWRLGNEGLPHDQLSPFDLTMNQRTRITQALDHYIAGAPILIEKTVGNSLRVPFVSAVLPEARFIHLIRDGLDVIESAYRQWTASPDWRYIAQKARAFPITQAFSYATDYARTTIQKLVARDEEYVGTWGPRYKGIQSDLVTHDLLEVCTIQWLRCLERAMFDLNDMPAEAVLTIRYEDFVRAPLPCLERIADFIGVEPADEWQSELDSISVANIGKGSQNLVPKQMALILPIIDGTLKKLGYL